MNWESLDMFLQMGGYGFYVWTSFGVTFACLIIESYALYKRRENLKGQK